MTLGVAAPESLGATTTILEYYVGDVDETIQRAIDAGAKPMLPITDAFYGDRFGWVLDPFGHIWAIGTVKEELTPEQVHQRMVATHS
jgi:PhnB protein